MRLLIVSGLAVVALISRAGAEEVGQFRNDWTGNSIVVEAVPDPKVQGVSCHISRFSPVLSTGSQRETGSSIHPTRRSPAGRPAR